MRLIRALPVLSLVVPAICDEVGSLISEIKPLITKIPQIIEFEGPALLDDLAVLISEYAPTGVVSGLPALLQTAEGAIETFLGAAITELIPPGAVPTSIMAEIPALLSDFVPEAVSELDNIISGALPATLSDAAIPSLLASMLPAIATDLEILASEELPALSSFLEHGGASYTGPASSAAASTTVATLTTPSTDRNTTSLTTTTAPATLTGAASALVWHSEIAGVIGVAAVVAML